MIQFASVIVSAACDPPLIIWFQAHTGNGGLGVCVATVGSEVLMLAGGLYLRMWRACGCRERSM
jgi:Na+-driven multidrug efflux pump